MINKSYKDLEVYQAAFELQQASFEITRTWPRDERYALTDQLRLSSRSIGANLAEAWAKRRYPAHFLSKLTDADGEPQESIHWLDTAFSCGHIDLEQHTKFIGQTRIIGRQLGSIMAKHESFCQYQPRQTSALSPPVSVN